MEEKLVIFLIAIPVCLTLVFVVLQAFRLKELEEYQQEMIDSFKYKASREELDITRDRVAELNRKFAALTKNMGVVVSE